MSKILELSDWLKKDTNKFGLKKKWIFFSDLVYLPSGEKVIEGFRYFACGIDELLSAFDARDLDVIKSLEFALDEDEEADTSSVCLLMAYTQSGAMLALQPQEYQNYNPVELREPLLLEGNDAKAQLGWIREVDQSA